MIAALDPLTSNAAPLRSLVREDDLLKVAYVITRADDLGGAQIHVRDFATRLRADGHEAAVFGGAAGILREQLCDLGVPFVEIPALSRDSHGMSDFRAFSQLRNALHGFGPHLVSAHSSKAGILARVAARSLGLPAVFTAHGWAFSEGVPAFQRFGARWIERGASPLAQRIIVVSEYDRRIALGSNVSPSGKLHVIRNGMPDVPSEDRAQPERTPPRLMMIGRFAAQKDHATLFRALSRLMDREWRLDLVGGGPRQGSVRQLASEMGIADRVSFLGMRTDVSELLAAAQVYVLSSRWEGLPRSIIEAMRAGLPVVASDVGGVAEVVEDGSTGCLVPRGNVGALTARLRELLGSPQLRRLLGEQGRIRYETGFTFELMFERTLATYREVIDEIRAKAA
ncbi:MAG: glycosyltransferase family 4 protein [Myxococcota bacterium]